MLLKRLYEEKLAQVSYMVGCTLIKEAVVIDPVRDIEQYIEAARSEGLRITRVIETHIHADFASGALALAQATGAQLLVSAEGGPEWQYDFAGERYVRTLHHGDQIPLGNVRLEVLHTPGHTPEHLCFLLTDEAAATTAPLGLFSGDFLFVGGVGRPDLLEKAVGHAGTMDAGARQLFRSLQRLCELPDSLLILPGHGAGSACGKSLGGFPFSSLGYERLANPALRIEDEDSFVAEILRDQPEPPRYFADMKRVNRIGVGRWSGDEPEVLSAAALAQAPWIVDLRHGAAFASGHIPGSITIPLGPQFLSWAGSILPFNAKVALVAENSRRATAATRELALIGYDNILGWIEARNAGHDLEPLDAIPAQSVTTASPGTDIVVDVRTTAEQRRGSIPGACHIPLGDLQSSALDALPRNTRVSVFCQAGARSPIAWSILRRMGFTDVVHLAGGYDAWKSADESLPAGAEK